MVGMEVRQTAFSISSPRRCCRFGAALWWDRMVCAGFAVQVYTCGVVVAVQDVPSHLSCRGVAEAAGSMPLLFVCECATNMVLIRVKALTGTLVSGSGGGAPVASLSLLRVPLRSTLSYNMGYQVKTLSS
jgi:hypothetical protein